MKRGRWPWMMAVAITAIGFRLACWLKYQPLGIEPDGLGLSLLFWPVPVELERWWGPFSATVAGYWPPAFPAVCALFGRIVGDPILAGRLIGILCSGWLAMMIFLVVERLVHSRWAGLVGGLLSAVAPLSVAWDVRVRPETLYLAVALSTLYFAVRFLEGNRGRDLVWATSLAGAAAVIKYEAVVFAPVLLFLWVRDWNKLKTKGFLYLVPSLAGWSISSWWLWGHQPERVGDYQELFTLMTLKQVPTWLFSTLLVLPAVTTWVVAALVAWGGYWMATTRVMRPVFWLLAYLVVAFLLMVAVGYNWTSRYLLMILPFLLIVAAAGWEMLPPWRSLKPVVAAVAILVSGLTAIIWQQGEKDKWKQASEVGWACVQLCPDDDRQMIWADDPYLVPYWTKRSLQELGELDAVKSGDYLLLDDFFGALRNKRTVAESLTILEKKFAVKVLFDYTTSYRPLSGEVIDPQRLARSANLRDLGPNVFWSRHQLVQVRSLLVKVEQRGGL